MQLSLIRSTVSHLQTCSMIGCIDSTKRHSWVTVDLVRLAVVACTAERGLWPQSNHVHPGHTKWIFFALSLSCHANSPRDSLTNTDALRDVSDRSVQAKSNCVK